MVGTNFESSLLFFVNSLAFVSKNQNNIRSKFSQDIGFSLKLQNQLAHIEQEFAQKSYEAAKNQLHDLLNENPNNLTIRQRLGDVYWAMDQPEAAGRYWFLIEAETPEMVAATFAFTSACKNEPYEILRRLEFNGEVGELDSEFAKYMLVNLKSEAFNRQGPDLPADASTAELGDLILPLNHTKRSPIRRFFYWAGCLIAMALPIILGGLVIFAILQRVFGLF